MAIFNQSARAILLFLYVLLGNAVTIGIVRHITDPARGSEFHVFQLVFMTSLVASLCFIPWLMKDTKAKLKTDKFKGFTLRAVLEFVAFSASFYAITLIPMPMHTSILFMTPIFATVIALTVLREHGTWVTYACVAVGFAGMLVITQPAFAAENMGVGVLFALAAAMGFAVCGNVIKILTRTEPSDRVAFYMLSMTTVIAAPFALSFWQMPAGEDWGWLIAMGLIAFTIQKAVAAAISKVPFITLIPLNFAQLVFVSIIAYLFFAETVDEYTVIGSIVILAATLFNAWYSSKHAREMAAKEDLAATQEA